MPNEAAVVVVVAVDNFKVVSPRCLVDERVGAVFGLDTYKLIMTA